MLRLKADSQAAYERFLTRIVSTEEVWFLDDEGTVAGCDAHERDATVFPFFSSRAYAKRGAKCWYNRFPPEVISLEMFMSDLLPRCIEGGHYIGADWDAHMAGVELQPEDVLATLNAASRA